MAGKTAYKNKYATSDSEYNSDNGISTNKSASFQMDNGSMGDQGALKFRSQIKHLRSGQHGPESHFCGNRLGGGIEIHITELANNRRQGLLA